MAKFRIAEEAARESKVMAAQERDLMIDKRRAIYIALEELDFIWDVDEVTMFRQLWREGASINELEEKFDRSQDDIAALILDQARRGHIKARPMGLGA